MRTKPIAIFDIDGTIFRSSLTIELLKHLARKGVVEPAVMRKVWRSESKWINRRGHYDNFVHDVIEAYYKGVIGKRQKSIIETSREVVREQKDRTYRYTRDLLKRLRSKYFTIGISGSPLEVMAEYDKFLKFDKIYGTELGVDEQGRYTGVVLHEPPAYKKEIVLRYVQSHNLSLRHSIGVGDTDSDIGFLELVDRPIAFNPNTRLAELARRRNWTIVIERKDLVLQFEPKKVKYLKV